MNIRHVFTNSGHTATLPHYPSTSDHADALLAEPELKGYAPGGWGDGTGIIDEVFYQAHSNAIDNGTLWLAYDVDDPLVVVSLTPEPKDRVLQSGAKPCWGGIVSKVFKIRKGKRRIQVRGFAGKYDRTRVERNWQLRDISRFAMSDSAPFNFKPLNDQITCHLRGDRISGRIKHGATFKRADGVTQLDQKAASGDDSITLRHNWGGLSAGETIHIGDEDKLVKNTYSQDSTSIPLTTNLAHAHDEGTQVTWDAPGTPDFWWDAVVISTPGEPINQFQCTIERDHATPDCDWQVLRFNYPSGSLTHVATLGLQTNDDRTINISGIAGNDDCLMLRFRRTTETKKARGIKCDLVDPRVNGRCVGDVYESWKVVRDIATIQGDDISGIQHDSVNALPLDTLNASDADTCDAMGILSGYVWRRTHDGTQVIVEYVPWGDTTFHVADEHFQAELEDVQQYGAVVGPVKRKGGFIDQIRVPAVPAVVGLDDYDINLDKPPGEEVAEVIYGTIANYVARDRRFGRIPVTTLVNASGTTVPASRIRPGDATILDHYGNVNMHVTEYTLRNDRVELDFPDGYPFVDRYLALRTLLRDRGRGNKVASLSGLGTGDPAMPLFSSMTYVQEDSRALDYKAKVAWTVNETDEDGNPIFLKGHHVQIRRTDVAGNPLSDHVQKKWVPMPEDDGDDSSFRDRTYFERVDEPGSYYQHRVQAEAFVPRDGHSPWAPGTNAGGWSAPTQVGATIAGGGDPSNLPFNVVPNSIGIDVDQKRIIVTIAGSSNIWDAADPLKLSLPINQVLYEVATDSGFSNIIHRDRLHGTEKIFKKSRPGDVTYYARAAIVDGTGVRRGFTSTASGNRNRPPTPLTGPTITFIHGGKKGITAAVHMTYSQGSYGDDDVDEFIIQFQDQDLSPTDADYRRTHTIFLEPSDLGVEQVELFHHVKAGDRVRSRYKTRDTDGKKSLNFSPWSSTYIAGISRKPGPTSNHKVHHKTRGVLVTFDAPTAWDDGSSTGFTETEVAGYNVYLTDSAGNVRTDSDSGLPLQALRVKSPHHYFPLPASQVGQAFKLKVEPVGWDEGIGASVLSTISGSADGLGLVDADVPTGLVTNRMIVGGAIDYSKLNASLPAEVPGNYGTPVREVIPSSSPTAYRTRLSPNPGGVKSTDLLLNLDESPPRLYKYDPIATKWIRATDGTDLTVGSIIADQITTGTLTGVVIQGSTFQTAASGTRVKISSSAVDRIQFYFGSTPGPIATIVVGSNNLNIWDPNGSTAMQILANLVQFPLQADFLATRSFTAKAAYTDSLIVGTAGAESGPPVSWGGARLFYDNGSHQLKAIDSGIGSTRVLASF